MRLKNIFPIGRVPGRTEKVSEPEKRITELQSEHDLIQKQLSDRREKLGDAYPVPDLICSDLLRKREKIMREIGSIERQLRGKDEETDQAIESEKVQALLKQFQEKEPRWIHEDDPIFVKAYRLYTEGKKAERSRQLREKIRRQISSDTRLPVVTDYPSHTKIGIQNSETRKPTQVKIAGPVGDIGI